MHKFGHTAAYITRGVISTTPLPTPGTSHLCALPPFPPAPLPSFLFILAHSRALLISYSSLCHSWNIELAFLLPIHPSPFIQSTDIPQPSLALTGIRTSQRTESDISADQHTQSFSPTTPSPQNPNTHLKTKTPGGLKTHSLPHHSPGVATLFTTYLGEARTNEKWMTKHQDRSLPLPSMTLSNRLHIQSSVH